MASQDTPSDPVIRDALEQFEESQEGSEENREAYYDDMKFARLADQWPDAIKKQRTQEARPVLVINKLPALIRAVVNESRQNKPAIKISPVDSGADEDTAEVIGGLVRSIERGSSAEVAYDTALDNAVTAGFGFFRIGIDYAHDETFDLEATIKRIPNALMVHWDTSSTEFDASDWDFAFVSEMVREDEYKRRYPKASMVQFDGDSRNDASDQWINEDTIRIAEYFKREQKSRTLVQLAVLSPESGETDLQVVRQDELPEMARRFFESGGISTQGMSDDEMVRGFMEVSGVQERRRREVEYFAVKRRIINGVEVLEEDDWPGSMIPICPVWGDETFIDGRRNFRSMIRDAKDSQQMFNFWRSASTELVALAPKAPWVGEEGFVPKGHEAKWSSANTRSHSYLEHVQGRAPTRQAFAGIPTGVLQETASANEDMQAITGIYPSSIGARSNETSGKAILARERQGDISNFHFIDNLSRSIRYAGQVLVEIIPAVYSPRQTVRILGEDETAKVIHLTQEGGGGRQKGTDGQPELYNLSVGKYDVSVATGPSFATEREETRETLIEIMRQVPTAAPFIADVLLDHMDFVGADKIAKRLKSLLPEEVRQAEDAAEDSDNPEAAALQQQLQAKDMQFKQAEQAVMQEIQKITAENEQLKADKTAEMERTRADADMKRQEFDRSGEQARDDRAVKNRELDLKNREMDVKQTDAKTKLADAVDKARQPVVSTEQQWAHDHRVAEEKRTFEAGEKTKDRVADLAKTLINKAEEGDDDEVLESAADVALAQAVDLMTKALDGQNQPKRIIRDPSTGMVIGVETVTVEVN